MPISYQVIGCFVNNSILSHPLLTKSTLFVTTFIFVDKTVTKKQLQNHSLPADLQSHLWEHFRRSYLVSAHKSLDPAAGAGFLAAWRPCIACGCLRPSPSCRLVLDFQQMTRRHTVGRVHEIEQKKTRGLDSEQVRHED